MSPLRWFRRHATWMLIIFGVILMAIFGLGPVFDNMAQGFRNSGSGIEDEVIIEYRGGEVTRSKIEEIQRDHFATRRFLTALVEQAAKRCEEKDVQYQQLAQMIQPIPVGDGSRAADLTLSRKLMAERAQDEGIVVSDNMVTEYLSLLASNAEFSERDLTLINKSVNERIGLARIRNHLRTELLAMQLGRYTQIGFPQTPIPTEAAELYARANNRIECEVIPVSVSEYVSKVSGEPTAAEKKALFAKGKYEYAEADKKEPGFKKPREVNVQYFVAELQTFLANEKTRVTDEKVAAEYKRLVEIKDPLVVEVDAKRDLEGFNLNIGDDEDLEKESGESGGSTETQPDNESTLDLGETESQADESEGATSGAKEESSVEEPMLDLELESGDESSAAENSSGKTPDEKQEDGDQASHFVTEKKSHRVALTQDAQENDSSDEESSETQAQEEEVGGLANLLSDDAAKPADSESKAEKFKPLADVAEQIRERLALVTAGQKKEDSQKRAMVAMQNYQNKVLRWEAEREAGRTDAPKPELPDFEAMAKEYGLSFRETGIVDETALIDSEVGRVSVFTQVATPQGMWPTSQRLSASIMSKFDRIEPFVPQEAEDRITRNGFIYWISEKVEVRIPSIDEASNQIVDYWKYQQAIELATAEANKMAEKAKASGKKLSELYPETAKPTGEFSWFTPSGARMAAYGRPTNTERVGEEFMQVAFGIAESETSVAANESRDIVYVIQRITPKTSMAEIGDKYLAEQYFRFKRLPTDVIDAAQVYAQEFQFEMQDEFVEAMGIKRLK